MTVGDLVSWIGFPGASRPAYMSGPVVSGVIIAKYPGPAAVDIRYDVAWADGTLGERLYPGTLTLIEKAREYGKKKEE